MIHDRRHQCLIYGGAPSHKLPMLAVTIQRAMADGYRILYLNSAPMVAGLRSTLAASGVDVQTEIAMGRLLMSSDPVSSGRDFDVEGMLQKLENSLDEAIVDGFKGLWASGDMTWEFGAGKNFSRLLEYELGLEQLFKRRSELCGICQYHVDTLPNEVLHQSLLVHPELVISDTLTRINPHYLKSSWPADIKTSQEMDELIITLRKS